MDVSRLKACGSCGKAKRKCDKQFPKCSRCQAKDIECVYTASSRFIFYGAEDEPIVSTLLNSELVPPSPIFPIAETMPLIESNPNLVGYSNASLSLTLPDLQNAWFLTPQSWSVVRMDVTVFESPSKETASRLLERLRVWLTDWTTKGGNAFIHSRLYRNRQPPCIRDAFTMLSSYLSRTPKTESLLLNILEARTSALIESAEAEPSAADDCYTRLSRVHALFIYLVIGIFDGDIRQRHLSERKLSTLRAWMDEMISSISSAVQNGSLFQPGFVDDTFSQNFRIDVKQSEILWHAWIVSESIRRTWVTAHIIHGIITSMLESVPVCECLGLKYTTRRGVWDASSAFSWTKVCLENDTGLLRRDETVRLAEYKPDEVDTFGAVLMEFDFGKEKLNMWGLDLDDDGKKP
jgi:Fungal Zn(2)-Cys(6) binuclear cluster domain